MLACFLPIAVFGIPMVKSVIIQPASQAGVEELAIIGLFLDDDNRPMAHETALVLIDHQVVKQIITDERGMFICNIPTSILDLQKEHKIAAVSLTNNTLARAVTLKITALGDERKVNYPAECSHAAARFYVIKHSDNPDISFYIPNKGITRDSNVNFNSNVDNVNIDINPADGGKVSKSGDTMTGALQLPAGSSAAPSLNFTGSANTGLSANAGALSLNTNGTERLKISNTGVVSIDGFSTAGVVHNDGSGNLASSLIMNNDISNSAAISDSKLAMITSVGKVANSATTATSASNPNTIVSRNAAGNFSAGVITASLNGSASQNVLKSGDTMAGNLTLQAGTLSNPSLQFTGSANTGLSAISNALSLIITGSERLKINNQIAAQVPLVLNDVVAYKAVQSVIPSNSGSVVINPHVALLILKNISAVTNFGVAFPPNPIDGQLFTIIQGSTSSTGLINVGGLGGAGIVNGVIALNPSLAPNATRNTTSASYYYNASANAWYRL